MRKCRVCQNPIPDTARICPHCGEDLIHGRKPIVSESPEAAIDIPALPPVVRAPVIAPDTIARVSVVDINMPFPSMVGFMVKWSIAAIPAFLILAVIGAIVFAVIGGLGQALR